MEELNYIEIRARYGKIFPNIDFDDLSERDINFLEEYYSLSEFLAPYAISDIEGFVINEGKSFCDAVERVLTVHKWLVEADPQWTLSDGILYDIVNEYNEGIFTISEALNGYTVENSIGYGSWNCATIEECIKVIEDAYDDTIIDIRKEKLNMIAVNVAGVLFAFDTDSEENRFVITVKSKAKGTYIIEDVETGKEYTYNSIDECIDHIDKTGKYLLDRNDIKKPSWA